MLLVPHEKKSIGISAPFISRKVHRYGTHSVLQAEAMQGTVVRWNSRIALQAGIQSTFAGRPSTWSEDPLSLKAGS